MHLWAPPEPWPTTLDHGWAHVSGITFMLNAQLTERMHRWCKLWTRESSLSLDLNIRRKLGDLSTWRETLQPVMMRASLIFASRSELADLWGTDKGDALLTMGVIQPQQVLIVTDGAKGAWAYQDGREIASVGAIPVGRVQDVVGAGDGFAAGVLAGRWRGGTWDAALSLGTLVGAFAVAHPGDWEGYPYWNEVTDYWNQRWVDR